MTDRMYWHRQTNEPLFPDIVWSRPENKKHAGKLLVVGGNAHGFAAVAQAYNSAAKAGAGSVRALLPDSIQKVVGPVLENADFAPSTPSGSFARSALAELLVHATWADSVMLAGDLGRNSETSILLEQFTEQYQGQLSLTKDAADYFVASPTRLLHRSNTTLVLSMAQLQKMSMDTKQPQPITFAMDLLHLAEALHKLSSGSSCNFVVKHLDTLFVASGGQVSTTKTSDNLEEAWRVTTTAAATVWLLQNPSKPFEALTTAAFYSQR